MKRNRKMKFIILTFICISLIVWVTFMQTNQRNIFISKIDEEKKAVINQEWGVKFNGNSISTLAVGSDYEPNETYTQKVKKGENFTLQVVGTVNGEMYYPGSDYEIDVYYHQTQQTATEINLGDTSGRYSTIFCTATEYNSTDDSKNIYTVVIKPKSTTGALSVGKKFYIKVGAPDTTGTTVPVTNIRWINTTDAMNIGDTYQFEARVVPSNATNQGIFYTTNNISVAGISTTGNVRAESAGTATISAISTDGNYKVTCELTVIPEEHKIVNLDLQDGEGTVPRLTITKDGTVYVSNGNGWSSNINNIGKPTKEGFKFKGFAIATTGIFSTNFIIDENGNIADQSTIANLYNYIENEQGKGYYLYAIWESQEKTIAGISVSANPTKTTYIKGESLDLTGGEIKVIYDNGETEDVLMTSNEVSVTGYDKDTLGTQELTITYKEKTAKFNVTVEEKNIGFEVEATKDNKDNKIVKVIITDAEREVSKVTVDDTEIEKNEDGEYIFTPTKNGNYTIKVTYTDGTTETYVYTEERFTDEERTITGISVSSKPIKTTYTEGESLDLTGGKITVTYDDGETEDVPMTSSEVSVTGYDKDSIGTQELIVTYKGKIAKFEVTVEKLKDDIETETPSQDQVYPGKKTDTTTAGRVIPKAGGRVSIIIAAISIGACAVFFKIKSERIDK